VEQLGGAITDQLAELFDEEPRSSKGRVSPTLQAPPTVQGPSPLAAARKSTTRQVVDALR
jgi:cobaltochelatase CobT